MKLSQHFEDSGEGSFNLVSPGERLADFEQGRQLQGIDPLGFVKICHLRPPVRNAQLR